MNTVWNNCLPSGT